MPGLEEVDMLENFARGIQMQINWNILNIDIKGAI